MCCRTVVRSWVVSWMQPLRHLETKISLKAETNNNHVHGNADILILFVWLACLFSGWFNKVCFLQSDRSWRLTHFTFLSLTLSICSFLHCDVSVCLVSCLLLTQLRHQVVFISFLYRFIRLQSSSIVGWTRLSFEESLCVSFELHLCSSTFIFVRIIMPPSFHLFL